MTKHLRRLIAIATILASAICASPSFASCGPDNPNCIVPTRPLGDNTNAAASTAFVQQNAASSAYNQNVISNFGAHGNSIQQHFNVTINAPSQTVTLSQTPNWPAPALTSAMVGMPVTIPNAGIAGALYAGVVALVQSSSVMTVKPNPSASVAGTEMTVIIGYDDTAALQNGFNASTSQPLSIPCGTYLYSSPLTLPTGGIVNGSANQPYLWYPGSAGTANAPCQILEANAFSSAFSGSPGYLILGANTILQGVANDVHLSLSQTTVPNIYGNQAFAIVRNNYTYGGERGIDEDYNASPQNQGWQIEGNYVSQSVSDGIYINSASDTYVYNNWVHSPGGNGANVIASPNTIVLGNVLENTGFCSLSLYGNTANVVSSNKLINNDVCGIDFNTVTNYVSVVGNEIIGYNSNLRFDGANTGNILLFGNSYPTGYSLYQARIVGSATVGANTFISEVWPSQIDGIYYDSNTRTVLQPFLLSSPNNLPGPYANDAAAAAAGVPIGAEYYDTSGIRRQRVS